MRPELGGGEEAGDQPTLLIHGDKDPDVPFHQSEILAADAETQGLAVKVVRGPGGVHDPAMVDVDAVVTGSSAIFDVAGLKDLVGDTVSALRV